MASATYQQNYINLISKHKQAESKLKLQKNIASLNLAMFSISTF